jgi:hypothetical protein
VLALESLEAVRGRAARAGNLRRCQRRIPHRPLSLGDVRADPFTWTHPETVLKVIQVLVDRIQFTLNPFQDLPPRGSGVAIGWLSAH